jgi:hypothetical protein
MKDEIYLRHILEGIVIQPEHMRLERMEDPRGILYASESTFQADERPSPSRTIFVSTTQAMSR